jgi:hypothetical protein
MKITYVPKIFIVKKKKTNNYTFFMAKNIYLLFQPKSQKVKIFFNKIKTINKF